MIAASSLLLVLPFTRIDDYVNALSALGRHFDQDSYTVFGLLVQLGVGETVARLVTLLTGLGLVVAMWRYRSFTLALAASLTLTPIVWLDYFSLAAVPLAIVRPVLSPIWLLPLLTWGAPGTGLGIGDPLQILRVLGVFAIVLGVATRAEHDLDGAPTASARATPAHPVDRAFRHSRPTSLGSTEPQPACTRGRRHRRRQVATADRDAADPIRRCNEPGRRPHRLRRARGRSCPQRPSPRRREPGIGRYAAARRDARRCCWRLTPRLTAGST